MTVENATTIDMIGIDPQSGQVVMGISDHLDWTHEEQHLALLEAKINTCLAAFQNGQIVEIVPEAKGRKPKVELILQFEPPPNVKAILSALEKKMDAAGYSFAFRPLPEGYCDATSA
ncbi:MAG: hypothetical protein IPL62_17070 [Caulobacteraceae bacterium]|nr:hypothetical protein [Caulobacteraceae bacterium]